jgi:hypothetical protein
MPNPFDTTPVNVLQALMLGNQSYAQQRGFGKERELSAARAQAAQEMQSGNSQGALARLMQAGDMQGAQMLSSMGNNNRDFQFRQQESQRAQQNSDRSYGLQERALNQKGEGIEQQVAQRRNAANQMGLASNHPAYQSFILTGKMPREDQQPLSATDKKAILEADEMVLSNEAGIKALQEAKKLSPTAHTGYGADLRATLGNNLPDWMIPDRVASPQSAADTTNFSNLVLGQALSSLKATFGAAPTEGERKILIELQASADKPDKVRQDILSRAEQLAQKRLEFNRKRAEELRGGTFYKPQGGGPQQGARPASQGISQQEWQALAPGTPYTAPDGSQRIKQ